MASFFLNLFMIAGAFCYNIDYEYSVVKTSSQENFFGFSVIQHQENDNNWMLVGAPKANSSFINKVNNKDKRSGTVFKCNATNPSLDCTEQVPFDQSSSSKYDSKTDQWLGVSLASRGGNILSCGHRYEYYGGENEKLFSLLIGQCYAVDKELFPAGTYWPCKTLVGRYESSNEGPGYQNYGQCQAGLGIAIQKSKNSGVEEDYSIGAIGALTFRGRVFRERADNSDLRWSSMDKQTKSFEDSYFGYAVALGKFSTSSKEEIAVAGPRHESHGKVLIYNNEQFKDTKIAEADPLISFVQEIPTDYVKADVQIASGFGIGLCAIDVDGDGFDDIVIGAPFYAMKKKPNMGKVYVYGRNASSTMLTEKQVLMGKSEAFASFGYAVANVGDLNLDGYPELAVGAPHKEDNKGAVFIYSGTNKGLSNNPQIIVAEKVMSALSNAGSLTYNGFGRSIAGGMDLDNNGYNDVLVGAYVSGHAVLLRSRPVIVPHSTMTFSTKQIDPEAENASCGPGKKVCFTASICHNITGPGGSKADVKSIDLKFKVTADADRPNDPRIYIEDSNVIEMIRLSSTETQCFEIKDMYLKFQPDGSIAEYPDVKFTIAYSIPYGEPNGQILPIRSNEEVVDLKAYPILSKKFRDGNVVDAGLDSVGLTFKRQCIKCIPDLKIVTTSSNFTLGLGRNEFEFNITIENNGVDPAYAVDFAFQSPETLKIALVKEIGRTKAKDCSNNTCKNLITKLGSKSKKHFSVILNMEKFKPDGPNSGKLVVSSANDEKQATLSDNYKVITFDIKVVADIALVAGKSTQQVAYTGKIKGEKAMIDMEDIGNEVEHRFAVRNRGPDLLPVSILTIQWPALTVSGKHLMYLTDAIKSSRTVCGTIDTNTANIKRSRLTPSNLRTRREVSNEKNETTTNKDENSEKTKSEINVTPVLKPRGGITLQCGDGSAICETIRCEIKDLPSQFSETIVFKARLWEPSLLLDYYGEVLTIVSSGTVKLGQNASYISDPDPNNNYNEIYTIINPVLVKPKGKIAVWIIALAVIAGIILLALLVFGLFKLGFFKRNRKPTYAPGKKPDN